MINYLFCLDENYNTQFLTTLFSLNQNSTKKFNVYVIHENPTDLKNEYSFYSKKFDLVNNIEFSQIKDINMNFPNLKNNHISKATYFRFFIEDYLSNDIKNLIYLDCDIICVQNPEQILNSYINKLNNSDLVIASSVEYLKNNETIELFDRLKLKSDSYFNAGVMVINYDKWRHENLKNKLLDLMNKIANDINFWDQDVLNKYFDGQYLEMTHFLNFNLNNEQTYIENKVNRNVVFVHYSGSSKPWTVEGVNMFSHNYFQYYYHKYSENFYFLTTKYRLGSLKNFFKIIFSFKIFNISYPFKFIKKCLSLILNYEK